MQLTERCDVWRMTGTYDAGRSIQPVYTSVPCHRTPISGADKVANALLARSTGSSESFRSEGRESTDMFLLPDWADVQPEDEIRMGRYTDTTGTVQPRRYTVNGVRDFDGTAYQDTIQVFCTQTT